MRVFSLRRKSTVTAKTRQWSYIPSSSFFRWQVDNSLIALSASCLRFCIDHCSSYGSLPFPSSSPLDPLKPNPFPFFCPLLVRTLDLLFFSVFRTVIYNLPFNTSTKHWCLHSLGLYYRRTGFARTIIIYSLLGKIKTGTSVGWLHCCSINGRSKKSVT